MTNRSAGSQANATFPPPLPPDARFERFVAVDEADAARVVARFAAPTPACIVRADDAGPADLELLVVPERDVDRPELAASVRAWVGDEPSGGEPTVSLTLHGAHVAWRTGRAALVAPAERLESARFALVEFAYHEQTLRQLERDLAARWTELEADAPLAFDFHERWVRRRDELARRFQHSVQLRGRFARLLPLVHRPPVHPPTLASQISERLRERTRLADRLDFCDRQLEVFERVYDQCGERTSEFFLARKGHLLEWIIIVLLAFQTLLLVLERVAALGT